MRPPRTLLRPPRHCSSFSFSHTCRLHHFQFPLLFAQVRHFFLYFSLINKKTTLLGYSSAFLHFFLSNSTRVRTFCSNIYVFLYKNIKRLQKSLGDHSATQPRETKHPAKSTLNYVSSICHHFSLYTCLVFLHYRDSFFFIPPELYMCSS